MKMVDGSTVRHGRVDCSYHERASEWGDKTKEGERGDINEEGGRKKE